MGWRALPAEAMHIHTLDPADFPLGPGHLIPVTLRPRVCVVLDRLGDAVLDALTWDWPSEVAGTVAPCPRFPYAGVEA